MRVFIALLLLAAYVVLSRLGLIQWSVAVQDARNDAVETTGSTSPFLRLYNGTEPANCTAALSGNTLLAEGTLPSDWMANSSSGTKAKTGTWTLTGQAGAGAGTAATFWRLYKSDGTTCFGQGTVSAVVTIATSALTAANGNVLTFAATTGVSVGMNVSGTGVVTGSTVVAVTGTTVTLSKTSTAGVASAASITFGGDMTLDNNSIANAQTVTVGTFQWTDGNP